MKPEVRWPIGAEPQTQLMQKHDEELLGYELDQGAARPGPQAGVRMEIGGEAMLEG